MIDSKLYTTLDLVIQIAILFMHSTSSRVLPVSQSRRETLEHQIWPRSVKFPPESFAVTSHILGDVFDIASTSENSSIGDNVPESRSYIIMLKNEVSVDQYIDKLHTHLDSEAEQPSKEIRIGYVYSDDILHGFSAQLSDEAFEYVAKSSEVSDIVPDTILTILPYQGTLLDDVFPQKVSSQSTETSDGSAESQSNIVVQKGSAPWNLQRISQHHKLNYNENNPSLVTYDYSYEEPDGEGVFVYVLDTGARVTHSDFEGRVEIAAQFGGYKLKDGNGHGTHCAGVIAGKRWGVAKGAKVRAVKVLSDEGGGNASDIIAGIQYVLEQYRASRFTPTVASLSLGGISNKALDRAVEAAITQGVHFAVAAGNSNTDACSSSPASARGAIVVAASDISDNRAPYSNWGPCVTLFAPGSNVTSTWATSDHALSRISGTSMATPHVAGLMAYHLSQRNLTTTQMYHLLRNQASKNAIDTGPGEPSTTPNLLIFNGL